MAGISGKACSRCSLPFLCGPGLGADAWRCWCQEAPILYSRVEGADCLCPLCLAAAIREQSAADAGHGPANDA